MPLCLPRLEWSNIIDPIIEPSVIIQWGKHPGGLYVICNCYINMYTEGLVRYPLVSFVQCSISCLIIIIHQLFSSSSTAGQASIAPEVSTLVPRASRGAFQIIGSSDWRASDTSSATLCSIIKINHYHPQNFLWNITRSFLDSGQIDQITQCS